MTETINDNEYYINFEKQKDCRDCPFIKALGLDEEEEMR